MRIYVRLRKDTVVRGLLVVAESVGNEETETLNWLAMARTRPTRPTRITRPSEANVAHVGKLLLLDTVSTNRIIYPISW
jgi:hypothetical protein